MEDVLPTDLEGVERAYNLMIDFFVNYGFQVVGAIIILLIGFWVSSRVGSAVTAFCERKSIDPTLGKFAGSTSKLLVLLCFVVISLGKFGISVAPFIAAIGAVGLGAGLAVQGLLSNYAAGLAIILTRPFKIGNTITVNGLFGQVQDIRLANTLLLTEDGEEITVPNKYIVGEVITNSFENRIVESEICIDYEADSTHIVKVLEKALGELDFIVSNPAPMIGIDGFGPSAMKLGVRCWVPTKMYYPSRYAINQAILQTLHANGVTVALPRSDVSIVSTAN